MFIDYVLKKGDENNDINSSPFESLQGVLMFCVSNPPYKCDTNDNMICLRIGRRSLPMELTGCKCYMEH